tara:strand:- start:1917 stop:2408 length:492 start_codon:yes stop_codon:yes gene_type:complete
MKNIFTIDRNVLDLIDNVRGKFPPNQKRSSIIESLLILQHHYNGYISKEMIEALASYLSVEEIDVLEVATFYTMLNLKPVGRNTIAVCNNVSCMLKGSDAILSHIQKKLNINVGESTRDNKFYLKDEIECLAACNGGPMMQVNHKNYENLTIEEVDKILDNIK